MVADKITLEHEFIKKNAAVRTWKKTMFQELAKEKEPAKETGKK